MEDHHQLSLAGWAEIALEPREQRPACHHLLLIEHLEAVAAGAIDRLMVLMPPGSAKSTYASEVFPAWWLHRFPMNGIIAASHTAELAKHFGRKLRNLIADNRGVLGYGLASDNRAASRFETTQRGEYFAAGLGGPITGRRADLVLIDDPIKNHGEAESSTHRDYIWDWYRSELLSRLKPRGRIVLIMTRWHDDDLAGRLLGSGDNWQTLTLPALAGENDPLGRAPGEPLWPEYIDMAALERARNGSGERVWQAQYQQDPRANVGEMFPIPKINTIEAAPAGLTAVRAWDLAATSAAAGGNPDWTVGLKLARDAMGRSVVLDVVRLQGGPLEVADAIVNTARQDGRKVHVGLPQDPGQAGKQQIAWLTGLLAGHTVHSSPETGAKAVRAMPIAAQTEAGNLAVVRAGWNRAFLDELRDFPAGRKDDQVDALARAFAMLTAPPKAAHRRNVSLFTR